MKTYNLKITVDCKKLRNETTNKTDTIPEIISNEFGWLHSSGIYLLSVNN